MARYGVRHGVHGLAAADLAPSWAVVVVVAPVLVYNFLGFELLSVAAEELRDSQRDVPASILRAGALTCACTPCRCWRSCWWWSTAAGGAGRRGRRRGLRLGAGRQRADLDAGGVADLRRRQPRRPRPGCLARVSARTGTSVAATLAGRTISTATTLAAFAVAGDDHARYFSLVLALSIAALAAAAVLAGRRRRRADWPPSRGGPVRHGVFGVGNSTPTSDPGRWR